MTGESATPSHPCSHIRQDPFTSDSDQSLIPHLAALTTLQCKNMSWPGMALSPSIMVEQKQCIDQDLIITGK